MVPNTDWCTPSVIRVTPSVACTASCAIGLKSEDRRLIVGRSGGGVMGFEGIYKCNAYLGQPLKSPGSPSVTPGFGSKLDCYWPLFELSGLVHATSELRSAAEQGWFLPAISVTDPKQP